MTGCVGIWTSEKGCSTQLSRWCICCNETCSCLYRGWGWQRCTIVSKRCKLEIFNWYYLWFCHCCIVVSSYVLNFRCLKKKWQSYSSTGYLSVCLKKNCIKLFPETLLLKWRLGMLITNLPPAVASILGLCMWWYMQMLFPYFICLREFGFIPLGPIKRTSPSVPLYTYFCMHIKLEI